MSQFHSGHDGKWRIVINKTFSVTTSLHHKWILKKQSCIYNCNKQNYFEKPIHILFPFRTIEIYERQISKPANMIKTLSLIVIMHLHRTKHIKTYSGFWALRKNHNQFFRNIVWEDIYCSRLAQLSTTFIFSKFTFFKITCLNKFWN